MTEQNVNSRDRRDRNVGQHVVPAVAAGARSGGYPPTRAAGLPDRRQVVRADWPTPAHSTGTWTGVGAVS